MSLLPSVEIEAPEEDSTAARIKELASEHVPAAIRTLAKLNKGGKKVSPAVQRAAANDILTQAAGRPEARQVQADAGGLKIIINQLYADPKTVMSLPPGEKVVGITPNEVQDALVNPVRVVLPDPVE